MAINSFDPTLPKIAAGQPHAPSALTELPNELILYIAHYVAQSNLKDLAALALSCKKFRWVTTDRVILRIAEGKVSESGDSLPLRAVLLGNHHLLAQCVGLKFDLTTPCPVLKCCPGYAQELDNPVREWTIAHVATYLGHSNMIEILANSEVPELFTQQDRTKRTPAWLAADEGHTEVINALMQVEGIRETFLGTGPDGKFPLHTALLKGHVEAARAIVAGTALPIRSFLRLDKYRRTALHYACMAGLPAFQYVRMHIEREPAQRSLDDELAKKDRNNKTPPMCALEAGNCAVLRELLELGKCTVEDIRAWRFEDLYAWGMNRKPPQTALQIASTKGFSDIIQLFSEIGYGVTPDALGKELNDSILLRIKKGAVILSLSRCGANTRDLWIRTVSNTGMNKHRKAQATAILWAVATEQGRTDWEVLAHELQIDIDIERDRPALVQELIADEKLDLLEDYFSRGFFTKADCLQFCVERVGGCMRKNAVHIAALNGCTHSLRFLGEVIGISPEELMIPLLNPLIRSGTNAAHLAAQNNHPEVITTLAELGVSAEALAAKNETGLSPADIAQEHGNYRVIEALKQAEIIWWEALLREVRPPTPPLFVPLGPPMELLSDMELHSELMPTADVVALFEE